MPAMPISCFVQIFFASSVLLPARLLTAMTKDKFNRCICRQTSSAMRESRHPFGERAQH